MGNGFVLFGWVNYCPIFFKPGTDSTIVGRRWIVLSSETGLSAGCFVSGRIAWNWNIKMAVISGEMSSGDTFEGVLNHLPFLPRVGLRLRYMG